MTVDHSIALILTATATTIIVTVAAAPTLATAQESTNDLCRRRRRGREVKAFQELDRERALEAVTASLSAEFSLVLYEFVGVAEVQDDVVVDNIVG